MWWDILKGSLTTAEYLKELDKFRMFRRIGFQSENVRTTDNLTVKRKKGNMDTDYEKLFYDNEIEEGVEGLFKFRGGSFVKELDDYTVYFSLEEQENLHHFIFKVKVTNISPEKQFKMRDADKEFEWEVIFFNEKETDEGINEETFGEGWFKPEVFPLELFVNFEGYSNFNEAEAIGKRRRGYFISNISDVDLKDNWKDIVKNVYLDSFEKLGIGPSWGYRTSRYYQDSLEKIIQIFKENSPFLSAIETNAENAEAYYSRLPDGPPPTGYGRRR